MLYLLASQCKGIVKTIDTPFPCMTVVSIYTPDMLSKRTYITIPAKDYAEAKRKAKDCGLSFSALVRIALKKFRFLEK